MPREAPVTTATGARHRWVAPVRAAAAEHRLVAQRAHLLGGERAVGRPEGQPVGQRLLAPRRPAGRGRRRTARPTPAAPRRPHAAPPRPRPPARSRRRRGRRPCVPAGRSRAVRASSGVPVAATSTSTSSSPATVRVGQLEGRGHLGVQLPRVPDDRAVGQGELGAATRVPRRADRPSSRRAPGPPSGPTASAHATASDASALRPGPHGPPGSTLTGSRVCRVARLGGHGTEDGGQGRRRRDGCSIPGTRSARRRPAGRGSRGRPRRRRRPWTPATLRRRISSRVSSTDVRINGASSDSGLASATAALRSSSAASPSRSNSEGATNG